MVTSLLPHVQYRADSYPSGFIEAQGYTAVDFYERVRQAQDVDPWSHEAVFAKIMIATADFDIFMRMMREAAEALPQNKGGDGVEDRQRARK